MYSKHEKHHIYIHIGDIKIVLHILYFRRYRQQGTTTIQYIIFETIRGDEYKKKNFFTYYVYCTRKDEYILFFQFFLKRWVLRLTLNKQFYVGKNFQSSYNGNVVGGLLVVFFLGIVSFIH